MTESRPVEGEGAPRVAVALFLVLPVVLVVGAALGRSMGLAVGPGQVRTRVLGHLPLAERVAAEERVELPLLLAVVAAESGGRPDAQSPKGAVGLMQLLEGTARDMAGGAAVDRMDPETSLRLGARYLRRQLDRFAAEPCAVELALAAYNAGPAKVRAWLRERPLPPDTTSLGDWVPYAETRAYVRRVHAWKDRWDRQLAP